MEIFVISKSFIVREAMEIFFKSKFENCNVKVFRDAIDVKNLDLSKTELIFWDVQIDMLKKINFTNNVFNKIKILVYDSSNNKEMFSKFVKSGIYGYIVDIAEEEDLIYIVKKILSGKKYYDSEVLVSIFNNNYNISHSNHSNTEKELSILTFREREIFEKVKQGLTNKEISKELYITEHTIKKHITSILSKLNMRNRKEIILSGNIGDSNSNTFSNQIAM